MSLHNDVCGLFIGVLPSSNIFGHIRMGPTCDSVHSWELHSEAPLGDQAASSMTWHPTQLYYPDTEWTNIDPILAMPITRLGSDIYQCRKSLLSLGSDSNSRPSARGACALPIRPLRPGSYWCRLTWTHVVPVARWHFKGLLARLLYSTEHMWHRQYCV